jgi:hypothetical protein
MISFNDVQIVVIESKCRDSCTHSARVTFNDGTTRVIPPLWIHAVISGLEEERINPTLKWKGAEVKRHFENKEGVTEKVSLKNLNSLYYKSMVEEL